MENTETNNALEEAVAAEAPFNYAFVETTGRIALYDDLRSAPRITEIQPAETAAYIEALASTVYRQSQDAGGEISYTIIREVAENFIHARFKEVVVSILDNGNTIRFADHGPGILSKEKAQMPGFTSAVEPMKSYIRGVGSGLPIVKEYLEISHGTITIEDNLGIGAVVTISLENSGSEAAESAAANPYGEAAAVVPGGMPTTEPAAPIAAAAAGTTVPQAVPTGAAPMPQAYPASVPPTAVGAAYPQAMPQAMGAAQPAYNPYAPAPYGANPAPYGYPPMTTMPKLNDKAKEILKLLAVRPGIPNKEIEELTETPPSTTSTTLKKLISLGLVESMGSQRWLTAYGQHIVSLL